QTINVPNEPNPVVTFYYRIYTQDWTGSANLRTTAPMYDWLGVYANEMDDAHHLWYGGNTDQSRGTPCGAPFDVYGKWVLAPPLSLAAYQGRQVTLYFAVWNQTDDYYNTYAYI